MAGNGTIAMMAHLMRRAGFGATRDELEKLAELGSARDGMTVGIGAEQHSAEQPEHGPRGAQGGPLLEVHERHRPDHGGGEVQPGEGNRPHLALDAGSENVEGVHVESDVDEQRRRVKEGRRYGPPPFSVLDGGCREQEVGCETRI